ncbi:MAG: (d)CMP kinase [Hyphomicrobiaceae bacterium]|nr:(d)CMP kinase [Hyphomicrobiaceae bacterium]
MIIAIDGPAASGKGTLAKLIAAHLGYPCLDTGLLYRAVARDVLARGQSLDDAVFAAHAAAMLDITTLDDPELRSPGAGDAASVVAKFPGVRKALLDLQRDFAARGQGAVLDGRDIGTVVCPHADVKIFVTADLGVRAARRFKELRERGEPVTLEGVAEVLRRRDERDSARADAPMKAASDAFLLDTTEFDIEQAFEAAVGLITRKIGQQRRS